MRDVARLAGVSEATVSLALAGSERISDATRRRVTEIASQVGYRPHAGARSLRTDSTRAIGLIVSDVANPFFAELAGDIERTAAAEGYSVVLCNSDEDANRQDDYLSSLLAGSQVDGVMLVPTEAMTPGIRAGRRQPRPTWCCWTGPIDVRGRGAAATPAARLPGSARLAPAMRSTEVAELLTGPRAPPDRHHRAAAAHARSAGSAATCCVDALIARGVEPADITVLDGDFRQHSGERATEPAARSQERPPTAMFAGDGLMADRRDEGAAPGRGAGADGRVVDRLRRRALVRSLRSSPHRRRAADRRPGERGRRRDARAAARKVRAQRTSGLSPRPTRVLRRRPIQKTGVSKSGTPTRKETP